MSIAGRTAEVWAGYKLQGPFFPCLVLSLSLSIYIHTLICVCVYTAHSTPYLLLLPRERKQPRAPFFLSPSLERSKSNDWAFSPHLWPTVGSIALVLPPLFFGAQVCRVELHILPVNLAHDAAYVTYRSTYHAEQRPKGRFGCFRRQKIAHHCHHHRHNNSSGLCFSVSALSLHQHPPTPRTFRGGAHTLSILLAKWQSSTASDLLTLPSYPHGHLREQDEHTRVPGVCAAIRSAPLPRKSAGIWP